MYLVRVFLSMILASLHIPVLLSSRNQAMAAPKAATRPAFDNRGKKDHIVATMVPLRRLIHSVPLQRAIKHYGDVFSKVVQRGWLVLAAVVLRSCLSENDLPSLRKKHAHEASLIVSSCLFVGTRPSLNRDLKDIDAAVLSVYRSEFSDKGWEVRAMGGEEFKGHWFQVTGREEVVWR